MFLVSSTWGSWPSPRWGHYHVEDAYCCLAAHHVVQQQHPVNVTMIIHNDRAAVISQMPWMWAITTENHSEPTCTSISIECFLASRAHWLVHKHLKFNSYFETQVASINYCIYYAPINTAEYNTPTEPLPHCLFIGDTFFNSCAGGLEQCIYIMKVCWSSKFFLKV